MFNFSTERIHLSLAALPRRCVLVLLGKSCLAARLWWNATSQEKQVKSGISFPAGNWQARGNIISLIWKRFFSGKCCPWNFLMCAIFTLAWLGINYSHPLWKHKCFVRESFLCGSLFIYLFLLLIFSSTSSHSVTVCQSKFWGCYSRVRKASQDQFYTN